MTTLLIVGMLALAAYGIHVQYQTSRHTVPAIERSLVSPYAAALASGDPGEAYHRFTSQAFRKQCSLEEYLRGLAANRTEFGELSSIRSRPADSFQSAGNLFSGRRYLTGGLSYRFEKREVFVVWEVVKEDDAYKLDATFQEFNERLDPRVF